MLQELHTDPSRSRNCLHIQEELLARIAYIENRIRKCRETLKNLKRQIRDKTTRLPKKEAGLLKARINQCNQRIDQYQDLLMTFKSVADGLAFIYVNRWDIKPVAFKEPAGFISGKKGLRSELKFLRHVFSKGGIGILNDLTNCLHVGDVCVALENTPYIFEIKSGYSVNARVRRQRKQIDDISKYLHFDKAGKMYGVEGDFKRISLHSQEVDHIDKFNSIITSAKESREKFCFEEIENGLYYGATYVSDDHMLDPIIKKRHGKLIVAMANEAKRSTVGYYPFSLSFYDSEAWYDFVCGELIILIAVDYEAIEQKLLTAGLSMKWNSQPDWFYESYVEINSLKPNPVFTKMLIGGHFLGRLFTEFLSLDWTVQSIIDRVNKIESKNS